MTTLSTAAAVAAIEDVCPFDEISDLGRQLSTFSVGEDEARDPRLVDVLNNLIDRSIARGAVWVARIQDGERYLYSCYDPNDPETKRPGDALSVACERYWSLCREILLTRALAAGGALSASTFRGAR